MCFFCKIKVEGWFIVCTCQTWQKRKVYPADIPEDSDSEASDYERKDYQDRMKNGKGRKNNRRIRKSDSGILTAPVDVDEPMFDGALVTEDEGEEFKVDPYRWLVLLLFALSNITNAIIWISFAPIQDFTADYFDITNTEVNILSIVYMILYLPGSALAAFAVEHWNLRWAMILGAFLNLVSCAFRYLSADTDAHPRQNIGNPYVWLLIGQSFGGLAQPFFTNLPARLGGEWFSVKQRDLATTLAAMANPIGIAIGQVLPTLVVTESSGMPANLLYQMCIAGGTFILNVLFFRARPKSPPSRTAATRRHGGQQEPAFVKVEEMWGDVKKLLSNGDFRLLLLGFGVGLGMFNTVTTLIEQLIRPCNYTSDDAGLFGALIIGCGLVGAGIIGPYMDFSHQYNRILKILFSCAFLSAIYFAAVLRPDFYLRLAIAFGAMGFFMLPILPVVFECGVECTHPVDEELSSGMLMLVGNLVSIPLIFLFDYLIDLRSDYVNIWSWNSLAMIILILIAVISMFFYNGPYNRLNSEKVASVSSTQSSMDKPIRVSQTSYHPPERISVDSLLDPPSATTNHSSAETRSETEQPGEY